jgi:hypothetical protein
MDPLRILVTFGPFKIFVGLYFRTPVPVQPMKAIGGMAIFLAGTITHDMISGSEDDPPSPGSLSPERPVCTRKTGFARCCDGGKLQRHCEAFQQAVAK